MSLEKKRDLRALMVLLIASALLLLIFSACSPLYPLNNWVDPNCFMTVARGMRAGMVPYRDLMEQKGPLLYVLHLLAILISPNSFHGVYPIEIVAHTVFLFAAYKTAKLFSKGKAHLPVLIASLMVLVNCYGAGDSAEMLCLPMLAWSYYDAARYFTSGRRVMKGGTLLLNGFLAGCVLWIKYSLLGLHFAWMAVIAIESVVRERRILPAVKMCLIFLAGMALSSLPWLIYFGANGAIGDLIDVYFVQNITGYTTDDGFFYNLIHGLGNDALDNLPLALLVFIGGVYTLCAGGWKHIRFKICTAAMAVCMAILLYMGGRFRGYTFYVFAAFLPLAAAAADNLLSGGKRLKKAAGAALALLLGALCVYEAIDSRGMLERIRWNEKNMVQYVFAEEINKTENPTLLNCGFLDGGFYLAADVIPTERWFCKLNVAGNECFEAQSSAVREGRVDYVVTWKNTLEDLNMDSSRYDLILEHRNYYLYKLENTPN